MQYWPIAYHLIVVYTCHDICKLLLTILRPGSAKKSYSSLIDHEFYAARKPKKKQPLYKRQPYVIRCMAYKNGDRDMYTQIASPNVKLLLEACTSKLQLNGAARRIFLEDGTEIFETDEIPKNGDIYVSNGEAFKSPFKSIIRKFICSFCSGKCSVCCIISVAGQLE